MKFELYIIGYGTKKLCHISESVITSGHSRHSTSNDHAIQLLAPVSHHFLYWGHGFPPAAQALCSMALSHTATPRHASPAVFSTDCVIWLDTSGGRLHFRSYSSTCRDRKVNTTTQPAVSKLSTVDLEAASLTSAWRLPALLPAGHCFFLHPSSL